MPICTGEDRQMDIFPRKTLGIKTTYNVSNAISLFEAVIYCWIQVFKGTY